ncbi:Na-translocating system protein MpsC family protein [Alicyclobacillus dauci]|uniref:DUF2294 domain-containing protein n=1 Tax=Alicyclobacillus dauci TaxID=1475485 RepID=A0ABY6Z311_9BACL|nr:Na-translocating system protein MpsC family protein [Alicyclobacillus dauci]WAH37272.1 DUF2294 domain-containing protein [Alicyclobacillus dauci]
MENTGVQVRQEIAGYIGKLLRDNFGKGPESVYVTIGDTCISAYIRNFLSPMEKILLEEGQAMMIWKLREQLMNKLLGEIRSHVEQITKTKLNELYYDWNFHNRSAIIFGVSSERFTDSDSVTEDYEGRSSVHREILKISELAEKLPDSTYSFEVADRMVVVVRDGILVRIEKELIRLGHGSMLKAVKANLEKSFLHNNGEFEKAVGRKIQDCFVDWNFDQDKSVIVMMLQPPKNGGHGEQVAP